MILFASNVTRIDRVPDVAPVSRGVRPRLSQLAFRVDQSRLELPVHTYRNES